MSTDRDLYCSLVTTQRLCVVGFKHFSPIEKSFYRLMFQGMSARESDAKHDATSLRRFAAFLRSHAEEFERLAGKYEDSGSPSLVVLKETQREKVIKFVPNFLVAAQKSLGQFIATGNSLDRTGKHVPAEMPAPAKKKK